MENLNAIGIKNSKAKHLAEKLNEILSNYSIFYQNITGYHWSIKGEKVFLILILSISFIAYGIGNQLVY
jgi:starvation-inducible DNA-binding protein